MLARACAALLLAAPATGQEPLVVGSKSFPESRLLGEMLTLLLEEHTDLEVRHDAALGGTTICFDALVAGEIDVYPEYTGTAWSAILKEPAAAGDPLQVFALVQSRMRARFDLEWLAPFGFENKYAIAIREDRARELGVRALSDLVGREVSAGFSAEFTNRPDGWPGLARHYGLELETVRAMEHALAYEAVVQGELDLVDAYSTDAKLVSYALRVLEDDKRFFPPYQVAPVARVDTLRAHPEVRRVLELLAYRIDAERMTALNHAIEVEHRGFREVAREFLEGAELLTPSALDARDARADADFPPLAQLVRQHLTLTLLSVLFAALCAIPLGVVVARRPLGARISLASAGAIQTIPSLALLAFMIAIPGLGLSARSAVTALTLYALLPILRNTITGLTTVDPALIDAARGLGLTERQILLRVQLPLATRTIMAGIRTATVLTIGFATLAAFIGAGGLGGPILAGLYTYDVRLILYGALPAALLAVLADLILGRIEESLTPRGLRLS